MVFNYFFVSCFNWGILLYNVVLVSAVQQSELAISVCVCVCVYSLSFFISFPFRTPQSIK